MKKKRRAIETLCQEMEFKYEEKICTSARVFLSEVHTSISNNVKTGEASDTPRGIEFCPRQPFQSIDNHLVWRGASTENTY